MQIISSAIFLAVLSTITRLVAGQGCPEGTQLTNGHCCKVGLTYHGSTSGKIGACCKSGDTYYSNSAETAGTCCPPDADYVEATNKCRRSEEVGGSEPPVKPAPPAAPPAKADPCTNCEKCPKTESDVPKVPQNPQTPPAGSQDPPPRPQNPPAVPQQPILGTPLKPGPPPGPGGVVPPIPDGRCGCATGTPCFSAESLGIQYGKCYNLIDTNGLPLGRETNGVYQSGGDIGNLMFRVCKATDDCSADAGMPVVPHTGKFFLQDQQGYSGWRGPGWFAKIPPHFKIDYRSSWAAQFKGEGMCIYGSPAICLRDGEKEQGLVAPCPLGPNAAMAHIGFATNPNSCKAYRFMEASCMKNMVEQKP